MRSRTVIVFMLAALVGFFFTIPSFAQEMPKPGTVIDKGNYKQYAHLFPEELLPAFTDGFGGLLVPFKLTVAERQASPTPKAYIDYSMKNKGKYGLDAQGKVTGGWMRDGYPFPDLQRDDKDFVTKLMWNYSARYRWDDETDLAGGGSFEKRKGEPLRWNTAASYWPIFKGRIACAPKPDLPNPTGLYSAFVFRFILPESIKNTITLAYRYADVNKSDETYLYLPSMRRVLRAEAGQRSTPLTGSIQALDDLDGFDGNTNQFTYTLVREQKVLQVIDSTLTAKQTRTYKTDLPYPVVGYEPRDVYVIDIKAKDPKYPQGKKRIWMDRENMLVLYAVAWDRAGKVWKIWSISTKRFPVSPGGSEKIAVTAGLLGIDDQFGMATYYAADAVVNTCKYTYSDVTPTALLKLAR